MSDNLDAMFDLPDFDQLLNDSKVDNRVGQHNWQVNEVVEDAWPDGQERFKFKGVLLTEGNARADLTWSPPPPDTAEENTLRKEGKGTWEAKKVRGVVMGLNIAKQLKDHYGTSPKAIQAGQVYRVKTGKSKGGFIEVQAFLAKAGETAAKTSAPF